MVAKSSKISDLINHFIIVNEKNLKELKNLNIEKSDEMINDFIHFIEESNYNLVLINPFIELLQFLNNEKFINQFELDDIERLYDSLLKFKFIEYYIEASYFIWAVQDKKDKALKIAEIGLKLIEKKRCEMKELIYKIKNE